MKRAAAALTVVALLAVAGCAGVDIGTGPSGDSPSSEPIYETPLNGSAVIEGHVDAARAAGNYTVALNLTYGEGDGEAANTVYTVRGDPNSGAMYSVVRQEARTLQTYAFANGTAYHRAISDGEASYHEWGDRAGNGTTWAQNGVTLPLRLFEYTYAGVATADGERVFVYEADGADSLNTSAQVLGYFDDVTVTSAHSTLHVRADGLVTHATYEYDVEHDGGRQTSTFTATFSGVGATDVSPPAWVSTARNRTDGDPTFTDQPTENRTE